MNGVQHPLPQACRSSLNGTAPRTEATPSYGAEQQKTNKMSGECQRADSFDCGINSLLVHARFSFEKPSKYLLVPSIAASLFVYNPATI
jgi:hypothetical protein